MLVAFCVHCHSYFHLSNWLPNFIEENYCWSWGRRTEFKQRGFASGTWLKIFAGTKFTVTKAWLTWHLMQISWQDFFFFILGVRDKNNTHSHTHMHTSTCTHTLSPLKAFSWLELMLPSHQLANSSPFLLPHEVHCTGLHTRVFLDASRKPWRWTGKWKEWLAPEIRWPLSPQPTSLSELGAGVTTALVLQFLSTFNEFPHS